VAPRRFPARHQSHTGAVRGAHLSLGLAVLALILVALAL
jgi:hypothetical protein